MKTKLLLLVVITLAALNGSVVAGQALRRGRNISPRTVVLSLYSQHKRQSPFFQTRSRVQLDKYFTRELADLIWSDARSSRGEVGALDGDPLYNAQDMQIKNFSVRERSGGTLASEVWATFENFNQKHEINFHMVPAGISWKVADIVYDDGTTLAGILRASAGATQQGVAVKIYLVALDDNGKTGKKIGCGDSLVPVTRRVNRTVAPLKAALAQLLATPQHPAENPKLENFWKGRNLNLTSVSINNRTATIHLSGEVFVAGVCDIPRIESQIEETAKQFPTVKRVKVFLGGRTLREAIR
jgi:hypothetical protein